jgi:hypothetical protein
MKTLALIFLTTLLPAAQADSDCDCTTYPFKPNPPCYSLCVAKLSAQKDGDLSKIKGMDAGAALSIKVLSSRQDRSEIDFSQIQGKKDLENAALKSIENNDVKIEANRPRKNIKE